MDNRSMYSLLSKKALFIFFITLFFLIICHSAALGATVSAEIIHSTDKYAQGETYPILFRINIEEGWFIHGFTEKEDYLIPTTLSIQDSNNLEVNITQFPVPHMEKFEYSSEPVEVYSGTILVQGTVKVKSDSPLGTQSIKGNLNYQSCSSTTCLPPEDIPISIDFSVVTYGSTTNEINSNVFQSSEHENNNSFTDRFNSGLFLSLFWILLQGLALNLTPCIYPLIPITVSYFGGRSDKARGDTIIAGIIYISGLAVTNSLLGVTAALSGGMLGAALQYPAVLILIALIMTFLGFSFFGFWEFNMPSALTRLASKNYKGYFGTFFMGLTLGIVAAPCIGPFVLGLLIYVGQKGDPFLGFLYFFVLSIGIGLPLCILAIFSGAINRLPMSGDWMLWVRKIMGWILIAMGYYFISSLINNTMLEHAILFGLAIMAGIHLGWIDKTGKNLRFFRHIKKGISCIIILLGLFHFYTTLDLSDRVNWTPYDETLMEKAVTESKPVIMDVYADWCIPCRQMDKEVFTDSEVVSLSESFIMIRLDITRKIPGQDEIRRKYSIEGAPTNIFFNKNGKELSELRIESKVEKDVFIFNMKKTLGS